MRRSHRVFGSSGYKYIGSPSIIGSYDRSVSLITDSIRYNHWRYIVVVVFQLCWVSKYACSFVLPKHQIYPYHHNFPHLYLRPTCTHSPHVHKTSRVFTFSQISENEEELKVDLTQAKINNLPRLYTGPFPPPLPTDNVNPGHFPTLQEGSKVLLTPDQCHFITKVLRLFKANKRPKKNRNRDGDSPTQFDIYVRIFDGRNGEWLTQIHPIKEDEQSNRESDTKSSKSKRSRRKSSPNMTSETTLYASCVTQLHAQSSLSSLASSNENQIMSTSLPWVFFAPITKTRSKILVEKCTELGAGAFHPIMTERTDCAELPSLSNAKVSSCKTSNDSPQASILFQVENDDDGFSSSSSYNGKIEKYLVKLQKIALEASEQSERLTVPPILPFNIKSSATDDDNNGLDMNLLDDNLCTLQQLMHYWATEMMPGSHNSSRTLLVCRERSAPGSINILQALQPSGDLHNKESYIRSFAFLIGPEGGWSPEEEDLLNEYARNFPSIIQSVSLGVNKNMILRAETAAIMAMGAWALTCG